MSRITTVRTYDFRFPTSQTLSGSDTMNKDPDYSTAYAEISTDADDGIRGAGFVFTIGRGNDVVCKAIEVHVPRPDRAQRRGAPRQHEDRLVPPRA